MKRDVAALPPDRHRYVSLRSRAEFARVYREGSRRRVGEILVISAVGEPGPPQVGVVAGRRVGSAVVRNRVKRRLREALLKAELSGGTSYLIVALPLIADAGFDEIARWVRRGVRSSRGEGKRREAY